MFSRPNLLLLVFCFAISMVIPLAHAEEVSRPNIIVVLFDDMGWGQPPSYDKNSQLRTPHFDQLTTEGMRFTDAHSASAVCTPTRYGLLTGRYPSRIGQFGVLQTWSKPIIPTDRLTVASLLKRQGYETACIGKWHLGLNWEDDRREGRPSVGMRYNDGPNDLGFDYFYGFTHARGIDSVLEQNEVVAHVTEAENQPLMLQKAIEWLKDREPSKPFFLYFPMCPPHYPVVPTNDFIGKGGVDIAGKDLGPIHNPQHYPDWLYQGDAMLGEIMRVLDEQGFAENTLLIATSDNGAEHRVYAPLRESKRSIYEGGHRVPFVARWPGEVEPGTVWNHPICLNDLIATAAEITGTRLPPDAGEDSVSLLPALRGQSSAPTRIGTIHQSMLGDLAIRKGDWKLIVTREGKRELYNLKSDLSETTDMSQQHDEIVRELTSLLEQNLKTGRSTPGTAQANDFPISIPD